MIDTPNTERQNFDNLPDTSQLSPFQLKFIKAYIDNRQNATEAYLTLKPNILRTSASVEGCEMLKAAEVQRYLQEWKNGCGLEIVLNKETLINYTKWGLETCKAKEELGTLFKGVEVGAKLIGAYETESDALEQYAGFIGKIRATNVQININKP